jgi:hypothetical protein
LKKGGLNHKGVDERRRREGMKGNTREEGDLKPEKTQWISHSSTHMTHLTLNPENTGWSNSWNSIH